MKLIDADKLKADIERRKKQDVTFRERNILIDIEMAIISLQQEQPVDIPSAGSGAMGTTPQKFKLDVKPTQPGLEQIIHDKVVKLRLAPCYDELRDFALYFYALGRKGKEDK